jgi:hypothetical protein
VYLLKDDLYSRSIVSEQWHVEDDNCIIMQQACYAARKLDGQDNNKKPERK